MIVALINVLVVAFVVDLIVRAIEASKRGANAVPPPDSQAQLGAIQATLPRVVMASRPARHRQRGWSAGGRS